jgi:enterochelin esterase-like enzyme
LSSRADFLNLKVMKYTLHNLITPLKNEAFDLQNLVIESQKLASNALGDSPQKHNYVLVPKNKEPAPLIVHLAGYFGNGYQNFNFKSLDENFPQLIIKATLDKKIAPAVHVFVDAMTAIGGSQFINSDACGDYEAYIQTELLPILEKEFNLIKGEKNRCLFGASSGGYGSLHHISVAKSPFGIAVAIAPDSYFESSLLPEFYKAAPHLEELSSLKSIKKSLQDGSLKKKKNYFDIMNALAMTLCYSPLKKGELQFPIDLKTGSINEKTWNLWKEKDPVQFLKNRAGHLKKKMIYLDVGTFDEFSLFFGARHIKGVLEKQKTPHIYSEFSGGHFALNERKIIAMEWLKDFWN